MIEATKAYRTGDGQTFAELKDAQLYELEALGLTKECAERLLEHAEAAKAILKLKPRKARNGKAKKTKVPKVVAAA